MTGETHPVDSGNDDLVDSRYLKKKDKKKGKNKAETEDTGTSETDASDTFDDGDDDPPISAPPPEKEAPFEIAGERRNLQNIIANFQMAKARLLTNLEKDYGSEVYNKVLINQDPLFPMASGEAKCTVGRNAFLSGSENSQKAWARTVRKMKLNLLQYLIEAKVQDFVWATA